MIRVFLPASVDDSSGVTDEGKSLNRFTDLPTSGCCAVARGVRCTSKKTLL